METAGVSRDNQSTRSRLLLSDEDGICRRVHVTLIADHEVPSHGIHVGLDMLFFFSCQYNVPQLMHQRKTLLQGPAVQCLLHCTIREGRVVPYMYSCASQQTENNIISIVPLEPAIVVFVPRENALVVPVRFAHGQCALRSIVYLFSGTGPAARSARRASEVANAAC
jgi:hypothetical protein